MQNLKKFRTILCKLQTVKHSEKAQFCGPVIARSDRDLRSLMTYANGHVAYCVIVQTIFYGLKHYIRTTIKYMNRFETN